jgi:hypothetical protein
MSPRPISAGRSYAEWPFIYESWADLQLDEWTKVKIDVHGRQARLYVNGSESRASSWTA